VPFAAGGATDVLARVVAESVSKSLGQTIIVENVTGAAGSIGVARVARAVGDGYTLSIGTLTSHVLTGGLYKLDFDALNDLIPIAELAYEPLMICVKNALPVRNLQELIAWLKANPGKASVGIPGGGSTGNLAGIAFQNMTSTTFQFVPYRGDAPAVQDMMAGQIDMMIEPSSNFTAQVQAGTIRAIAVPAKTRLFSLPDVPTTDEAGLPGYYASIWFGMWAPKNTPKDVLTKLNSAVITALADNNVRSRLNKLGQQVAARELQDSAAFAAFQKSEADKWWPIIKAANIKVD
jgi:tripartite-type tricarboxylate transporter receptor subunit TctC